MPSWPRLSIFIAFMALPLGWRAERRYQQMPRLKVKNRAYAGRKENEMQTPVQSDLPSISIIVPARNEEANLERLLPSLCSLNYPGKMEVIVVDDNSVDGTAQIAHNHGVRVLKLDDLPNGWLGKTNACHQGTAVAAGEWFLFTDADTKHMPDGLAAAVDYALNNQLDGLTCHLQHKTYGRLDSLTLTAAYAGLFAGLSQKHTSMNGQYILLRRDVYDHSGGFAAVRHEVMEDLAMGSHMHSLGYKVQVLRGEAVAEVAMYQSVGELWQGMTRISAGSLRWSGFGSLITALYITALMTPLVTIRLVLRRQLPRRWIWITWATAVAGSWSWSKRFGLGRQMLFIPFGALFVQAAAVWGLFSRVIGRGLYWKGRTV